MNQRETDLIKLKKFIAEKDGDGFYNSKTSFIHAYEEDEEILLLLCQIFESDWHKDHENMARAFQSCYGRNFV
ncbi:hypothetical protein [Flavobacterium sp. 9]|uniref:hypothetical protein n=1 Tax=Flavobacterium sp. 9 TaxID=2035198 RepID=UPI000C1A3739|nr:hypothetical protein [Flavobacterium sp. 9]